MSYKVYMTDEAVEDISALMDYMHLSLQNPEAAKALYRSLRKEIEDIGFFPFKFSETGVRYRNYMIHKKVYNSYLIFYISDVHAKEVYILRILKNVINWESVIRKKVKYHLNKKQKTARLLCRGSRAVFCSIE